jgi:hypothetical protein
MRVVRGNPSTQVLKMKVGRDYTLLHGQGRSNKTGKARSALCVTANRILAFVVYPFLWSFPWHG